MTKRVIDLSAGLLVGATLGMAMNWTSFVAGKLIVAAAVLMAYPILDFAILPPGLGFGKLMAVGYVIVVFSCFCESTDAKAILWFWLSVIIGYLAGGVSCLVVWTFVVPCYASDKVVEELRNGVKALMTLHDHTWTEWQELNNAAGDEPDRDAKAERLAAQETESVKAREAVASSVYVLQTHLDQAEWEVPFIKMNGTLKHTLMKDLIILSSSSICPS